MPGRQSISAVFLRLCHLLFPFSTPDLLIFFLFFLNEDVSEPEALSRV